MKRLKLEGVTALLACFLCLAGAANAAVIYDSLSPPNVGADPVSGFGPLADSFSTGLTGFNLADVQLLLGLSPNEAPLGSVSVDLYNDSNTSPVGSSLIIHIGTVSDSALSSSLSIVDVALSSPYALAANTRYWLTLSTNNNSVALWGWESDATGTGVALEYFANNTGTGVYPNVDGAYQMALSGTAVPLPSAMLFFGPGLVGLAVLRRRFKK